jgi:hypothetical protein
MSGVALLVYSPEVLEYDHGPSTRCVRLTRKLISSYGLLGLLMGAGVNAVLGIRVTGLGSDHRLGHVHLQLVHVVHKVPPRVTWKAMSSAPLSRSLSDGGQDSSMSDTACAHGTDAERED